MLDPSEAFKKLDKGELMRQIVAMSIEGKRIEEMGDEQEAIKSAKAYHQENATKEALVAAFFCFSLSNLTGEEFYDLLSTFVADAYHAGLPDEDIRDAVLCYVDEKQADSFDQFMSLIKLGKAVHGFEEQD